MRNSNQRGIAIGPILFIVAILAVLAAAIAAGSGEFSGDTSAIKAKAQATAILQQAQELKFAVDRVLANGCTDAQLNFPDGRNVYAMNTENVSAPADNSCNVYHKNGGGVVLQKPPEGANKILDGGGFWTTDYVPYLIGGFAAIPNLGTNSNDLVLYLPISDKKLCDAINNILGNNGMIDNNGFYNSSYTLWYFTGSYTPFSYTNYAPGVMSSCVHIAWPDAFPYKLGIYYYFYYVLKVN